MICTVFRPKRVRNGKPYLARLFRGRYRLDGDTKIHDVPLHTTDKVAAQQKLREIIKTRHLEAAGIIPPEKQRLAAKSTLECHLENYLADLKALNRDDQYIYELGNRVRRLIRECKWKAICDITSDSFQTWRAKQKLSWKTLNEYLTSASSFLNWMEKHERIPRNPLRNVEKIPSNGVEVRPRRAYNNTEMESLLAVAGKFRIAYVAAVFTGLRRSELKALERDDLHLDVPKPFLIARPSTTKNHKQTTIALHSDIVSELREHLAKLPASVSRIFQGYLPTMARLKIHLQAAGIPFLDAKGRRVDFHSLRHTLNTNLAIAGVAPRVAMEIMRHSDMRLTAKTYTDRGLLPIADAVVELPSLLNKPSTSSPADSQLDSQGTFRNGQNQAEADDAGHAQYCLNASDNEADSLENDVAVTSSQNQSKSARYRVRTCDPYSVRIGVLLPSVAIHCGKMPQKTRLDCLLGRPLPTLKRASISAGFASCRAVACPSRPSGTRERLRAGIIWSAPSIAVSTTAIRTRSTTPSTISGNGLVSVAMNLP